MLWLLLLLLPTLLPLPLLLHNSLRSPRDWLSCYWACRFPPRSISSLVVGDVGASWVIVAIGVVEVVMSGHSIALSQSVS